MQRLIAKTIIRTFLFVCMFFVILSCTQKRNEPAPESHSSSPVETEIDENTLSPAEENSDLASEAIKQDVLRMQLVFEEMNAFEGGCSVVFSDREGTRFTFSNENSEVDMEALGLYTTEEIEGTPIPKYTINSDAVGKTYALSYRIEYTEGTEGEGIPTYILLEARMIAD